MKRVVSTFVAVSLLFFVSGACYNTAQIAPEELYKLNGYRGQPVSLTSTDGDEVEFSPKTSMLIRATDGGQIRASYSGINVEGSTMVGRMRGTGAPVNIDLSQVSQVETKTLSVGKTVGLAVGLGGGLIVVGIVLGVVLTYVLAGSYYGAFAR
ncbi:MAG: hypothetical protein IT381_27360 [Deltaproteobacteria bacterium]|nr:hypothetical protein [Deltaproteobacteria bacterium]